MRPLCLDRHHNLRPCLFPEMVGAPSSALLPLHRQTLHSLAKLKLTSMFSQAPCLQSTLFNMHCSSNLLISWVFEHGVRMDLRVVFTFCSAAHFL